MCNEYLFQKSAVGNFLMAFVNGREKPFHDMFQITSKFYFAYIQSDTKLMVILKKKASIHTISKENKPK